MVVVVGVCVHVHVCVCACVCSQRHAARECSPVQRAVHSPGVDEMLRRVRNSVWKRTGTQAPRPDAIKTDEQSPVDGPIGEGFNLSFGYAAVSDSVAWWRLYMCVHV